MLLEIKEYRGFGGVDWRKRDVAHRGFQWLASSIAVARDGGHVMGKDVDFLSVSLLRVGSLTNTR